MGQTGFWAAFIGAALVAMSNPISFGAFLGDWSRYIPRETPKMRIMLAVVGVVWVAAIGQLMTWNLNY